MLHHVKGEAPLSKVVRETQAEAVAFVVCRGVGLETNTSAADYIALYNGDKKTLASRSRSSRKPPRASSTDCSPGSSGVNPSARAPRT